MAITFPGEQYPPLKPDLEVIESFDNSVVGGVEKYGSISTGLVSLSDVVAKAGDTMTGTLVFDVNTAQGNALLLALATNTNAQPHIADADGTLADITTKFNTLLSQLETLGLLKTS